MRNITSTHLLLLFMTVATSACSSENESQPNKRSITLSSCLKRINHEISNVSWSKGTTLVLALVIGKTIIDTAGKVGQVAHSYISLHNVIKDNTALARACDHAFSNSVLYTYNLFKTAGGAWQQDSDTLTILSKKILPYYIGGIALRHTLYYLGTFLAIKAGNSIYALATRSSRKHSAMQINEQQGNIMPHEAQSST